MSTDALLKEIDRHLAHLDTLRSLTLVTCALARRERAPVAGEESVSLKSAPTHPFFRIVPPSAVVTTGAERGGRCLVKFSSAEPPDNLLEQTEETIRRLQTPGVDHDAPMKRAVESARNLNRRLADELLPALPDALAGRLGFRLLKRPDGWAEAVFHLGRHFPACGINTMRLRLQLSGVGPVLDLPCSELALQPGQTTPN